MPVNQAICDLRERLGLSQQEFAHKCKMAIHTLQNYEQRRRSPQPKQLLALTNRALKAGHKDLADIFSEAFEKSLGGRGKFNFKTPPSKPPEVTTNGSKAGQSV